MVSAVEPVVRQLWPPSSRTGSACRRTLGRAGSGCCCWCSCTGHHQQALPPSPGDHETLCTGNAMAHQKCMASHPTCIGVMGHQESTVYMPKASATLSVHCAAHDPTWGYVGSSGTLCTDCTAVLVDSDDLQTGISSTAGGGRELILPCSHSPYPPC